MSKKKEDFQDFNNYFICLRNLCFPLPDFSRTIFPNVLLKYRKMVMIINNKINFKINC